MADFTFLCSVADVAAGSMKTFRVGGKAIAVAHVDGEFFAVGDLCTHEQCSLGTEGTLDGTTVVCGCHGGQFDVTSGSVVSPPPMSALPTYEVKVEDGKVYFR